MKKLPFLLAILLYLLIYFLRYQQGGWEFEVLILKDFREALTNQINNLLPSPQAELLAGILLGQNTSLPHGLKLALRDTSTLHIVVASGQNLSMVAAFFLLLAGFIKKKLAITLSFVAILIYAILTGLQVPIIRAAVMVSLAFIAQISGRDKDSYWILIVTVLAMLLVNPLWISDISFLLSVLATFGVVVVAPLIMANFKKLPSFISSDLAVSLGAQIMVMPVIIQNFHQLSLVSLPTNLLVLWTVPFIMISGVVLLLTSWIPLVGGLVGAFVNCLLTYFIYVVEFFSSVSWSWIYVGEQVWLVWVGYYFILAAILIFIRKQIDTNKSSI